MGDLYFANQSVKIVSSPQIPVYFYKVSTYKKLFEKKNIYLPCPFGIINGKKFKIHPCSKNGFIQVLKPDTELKVHDLLFVMTVNGKLYYAYDVSAFVGSDRLNDASWPYGFIYLKIDKKEQVYLLSTLQGTEKNIDDHTANFEVQLSDDYQEAVVTVIRFKDGNVLIFSAGTKSSDNTVNSLTDVYNAYNNAKSLNLDAFLFKGMIWCPDFFSGIINTYFEIFKKKLIPPKELIIYNTVTELEITPSMKKKFSDIDTFDIKTATSKLVADKVFGISVTGVTGKIIQKTLSKTEFGKLLSAIVTGIDMANDTYSMKEGSKKNIYKEAAIKLLMFGFTLDNRSDLNDFFEELSIYHLGKQINNMTLDEALNATDIFFSAGSTFKAKAWGTRWEIMKEQMGEVLFDMASLGITIAKIIFLKKI